MLTALTTLFLLTAMSFAVVVMAMTLRESWGKVMAALAPVPAADMGAPTALRAKRITRRPATFRPAAERFRAAA